jgi:hypothetical protein
MDLTNEEVKRVNAWRDAEKELEESAHWIILIRGALLAVMGLWLVSVFFPGYVWWSLGGYVLFYVGRSFILWASYHVARFLWRIIVYYKRSPVFFSQKEVDHEKKEVNGDRSVPHPQIKTITSPRVTASRKTVRLIITESWKGQRPLYNVFWLYYIAGGVVIGLSLGLFFEFAGLVPSLIAFPLIFGAVAFLLAWKVWAFVSIWRCAPNSSATAYKFLARAYIVLFLIGIPATSIDKFNAYRQRGYEAVAKSHLRDAAVAQEVFYSQVQTYTEDVTQLYTRGLKVDPNVRLAVLPGKGGLEKANLIVARHIGSEKPFFFDSVSGEITETTLQDVREAGVQGIDP